MFPGDLHTALVAQQNVDDDYCACRVKAVGGEGAGIHIIGAPTFFLNRGPARSKSGPECV